jgi:hypothetical protein
MVGGKAWIVLATVVCVVGCGSASKPGVSTVPTQEAPGTHPAPRNPQVAARLAVLRSRELAQAARESPAPPSKLRCGLTRQFQHRVPALQTSPKIQLGDITVQQTVIVFHAEADATAAYRHMNSARIWRCLTREFLPTVQERTAYKVDGIASTVLNVEDYGTRTSAKRYTARVAGPVGAVDVPIDVILTHVGRGLSSVAVSASNGTIEWDTDNAITGHAVKRLREAGVAAS